MKHRVAGKTFGRRPEQKKALFRGLATSLVQYERIETTIVKAKEMRRIVEPLITLGKEGTLAARRKALSYLYSKETVAKLFGELAERFKTRQGGYTRIFHLGLRRGDGAEMGLIELIPGEKTKKKEESAKGKTKEKVKEPKEKKAEKTKPEPKAAKEKPKAEKKKTEPASKKASKKKESA